MEKFNCSYSEIVSIKTLKPHPKNPNKHTSDQIERLAKIIEYQGQRLPVIISKLSGFIVAGHGRLDAMRKLKWKEVAVDYQDFENEDQEYAFIVSDNAIAEWSALDLSQINLEIENLHLPDIDLLGLKDFTIDISEKLEPQCDEDEVPEVKESVTKRGDIWLLGNHKVCCGDSTMIDDVEKLMKGEKADMVFTDPPYKIETQGGFKGEIGKSLRKQAKDIEFIADFNPSDFLSVLPSVFVTNKINAYVFCNKELLPDYLVWARDAGFSFNVLIWKKPSAIPIGDSHRPDIEYLILFRKSAIWNNGLKEVNYSRCLEYGRETGLHPTMKPVSLIENELYISSNKQSVVMDFFLGSGSTLIACEKTNRKCYGMELDEHYCGVIIERWQKYTGKEAVLESTGETYNQLKSLVKS